MYRYRISIKFGQAFRDYINKLLVRDEKLKINSDKIKNYQFFLLGKHLAGEKVGIFIYFRKFSF